VSLLAIRGLSVDYALSGGSLRAVDSVSLEIEQGESVGVVGESGCGKTTLGLAIPLLLPDNATISQGSIQLNGKELVGLSEEAMRRYRWTDIAFIFQGAMNALNPVQRVDRQIREAISAHEPDTTKDEADARVLTLLDLVGIAASRVRSYPHEFSGGMRQRAMIAMSLACQPSLLIADEPTTALDVISQAQILALLASLQRRESLSLLMISHDLASIRRVCGRLVVMYAGIVVESGPTRYLLGHGMRDAQAAHPYTQALIRSHPDLQGERQLAEGLTGHPPDLSRPMVGCRFAERCPKVEDRCRTIAPTPVTLTPGHFASCHLLEAT